MPENDGAIETTTWGQVGIGSIVRDKRGRLHTIIAEVEGWLRLRSAHPVTDTSVRRPADDGPVDIYVPSESEATALLNEALGARHLKDIEGREFTIARRLNWRLEPVARKAKDLRDHIDMIHAVNVDDVLRKHKGTEVNPSNPGRRKAAIDELVEAHETMHDNPGDWPHAFPHMHTLEKIGDPS